MAQYAIDNRPYPINWQESDPVQRTLQNAKNLLMTRMGEVPYDRYRGVDPAIFDLPLPMMKEQLLPELDRVMLWEPDVEVVEADATIEGTNDVYITCIVEVTFE